MNLYDVLGVKKKASKEEIKRAYKKKAKETHPDVGGTEEDFKNVGKAYRILIDDRLRITYDCSGEEEEPTISSIEREASELVQAELISILMTLKGDSLKEDLISVLTKRIELELNQLIQAMKNAGELIKILGKIKVKIKKRSEGSNILAEAVQSEINSTKYAVISKERRLAVLQKATEILKDYYYNKDKSFSSIPTDMYIPSWFKEGGIYEKDR